MRAKRSSTSTRARLPVAAPAGEITAAFEREKSRFLARNAGRCPYLLVQLQPEPGEKRLAIIASFAFSEARNWHQVEAHVPFGMLQVEAGPEPRFAAAFAELDDGIGAARIARLFSPLSTAQRMASARRA
jgi:hypothetical protein